MIRRFWEMWIPDELQREAYDDMRVTSLRILTAILVISGFFVILGVILHWPETAGLSGIVIAVSLLMLRQARRGNLMVCRVGVPLAACSLATYLIATNDGLYDEALLLYPLTLILAGLLQGKRAVAAYTFLTLSAVAVIGTAENYGVLNAPFPIVAASPRWLIIDALLGFMALLLYFTIANLSKSAARSRRLHADVLEELARRRHSEDILRKYERMVSATSDHFALVDHQYTYQVVNDAYLHDTRKRYEEIVGHSVSDVLGSEVFATQVKGSLDRCLKGETVNYQAWFEFSPCTYQFMDVTYSPYQENDGRISGAVVSARDITTIKQAEEWLLQLAKAVETTRIGITMTDSNGTIQYVNPAEARMHGYTAAELVGQPVGIFAPPDLRKPLKFDRFADEKTFARESINIRKDGSRFPVYLTSDIVRNPEGTPIATVTICEDISERKRQEHAMEHANQELKARVKELMALNRMTQTLISNQTLQEILDSVALAMRDLFQVHGTAIGLFTDDQTECIIQAHAVTDTIETPPLVGYVLSRADFPSALLARLLEHRQTMVITQARQHPFIGVMHDFVRSRNIGSLMLVPLHIREQILGIVILSLSEHEREFRHEDIRLAETIAGQMAGLIDYARVFEQERRQRQVAESLREVALVVTGSLDLHTVLAKIFEQLRRVMPYDSAAIFLQEGHDLVLFAGAHVPQEDIGTRIALDSDSSVLAVFHQRQPCIIPDVQVDPDWEVWHETTPIRCWMGIPLVIGDRAIGMLTADRFEPGTYHAEDLEILHPFANQAAIAIHNARLFDESQQARQAAEEARREAEAAHRAKSEFLANTSHEFRTPLHAILGNTQLLRHDTGLSKEQRQQLATIQQSGEHLLELINAVIEIARLEPAQCDVAGALDHILAEAAPAPSVTARQPGTDIQAALAQIPRPARAQLESAALDGDVDQIDMLIEQLRPDHPELTTHLTRLADEFQYGEILKLLVHDPKKL